MKKSIQELLQDASECLPAIEVDYRVAAGRERDDDACTNMIRCLSAQVSKVLSMVNSQPFPQGISLVVPTQVVSATPWRVVESKTGSQGIESPSGMVALCHSIRDARKIVTAINGLSTKRDPENADGQKLLEAESRISELEEACAELGKSARKNWDAYQMANSRAESINNINKELLGALSELLPYMEHVAPGIKSNSPFDYRYEQALKAVMKAKKLNT